MFGLQGPHASLGMLHVFEDVVSILEGDLLDDKERRKYVLSRAKELFGDAVAGAKLIARSDLYVPPSRWKKINSFIFLSNYLRGPDPAINVIVEIDCLLAQMMARGRITKKRHLNGVLVLKSLCICIERDMYPLSHRVNRAKAIADSLSNQDIADRLKPIAKHNAYARKLLKAAREKGLVK